MCLTDLLEFGEVLDGTDHLGSVGVLVVVPGDDLNLIGVVIDLGDHGLGGVEQGTELHADDVGADDLVLGVAEGQARLCGNLCQPLLKCIINNTPNFTPLFYTFQIL